MSRHPLSTDTFIEKSKKVHNDKYKYTRSIYTKATNNIAIICPEHGEFIQKAISHMNGYGCPKCGGGFMDTEFFKVKATKLHCHKYNYTKANYINAKTKVAIICPEHGEFKQIPNAHLNGQGCPKCGGGFMDTEFFKVKATKLHYNKYDYTKVDYINAKTKVAIICPEHGEFKQIPPAHLSGQGCPKCSVSKGHLYIRNFLTKNRIYFEEEKEFADCVNPLTNCRLRYDFFLPELSTIIEFDGSQHSQFEKFFHKTQDDFRIQRLKDLVKDQYAAINNIKLIRIDVKYNIDILI
jgi:ssDNA-binding Zn-finger/Zn-ribbon topoisomerase 1